MLFDGVEIGQTVTALGMDGAVVEITRLTKLLRVRRLERLVVERVVDGEIVTLAGLKTASMGETTVRSGRVRADTGRADQGYSVR